MKCVLFADDTTVYHSGSDTNVVKKETELDLEMLCDWLLSNRLSLSIAKTTFMHFKWSKYDNDINLKFGEFSINKSDNVKFLGVWIDNQLKWNTHLEYVMKKINSGLYA